MMRFKNLKSDLKSSIRGTVLLKISCVLFMVVSFANSQELFPAMTIVSVKGDVDINYKAMNSKFRFKLSTHKAKLGFWVLEGDRINVKPGAELILKLANGFHMVVFENTKFKVTRGNAKGNNYPSDTIEIEEFFGSIGLVSKKTPHSPQIKLSNNDGIALIQRAPGSDSSTKIYITANDNSNGTILNVCEGYVDVGSVNPTPVKSNQSFNLRMFEGKPFGEFIKSRTTIMNEQCLSLNYISLNDADDGLAAVLAKRRWSISEGKIRKEMRADEKKNQKVAEQEAAKAHTEKRVHTTKEHVAIAKKMSIPELEAKVKEIQMEMKEVADSGQKVSRQMKTNLKIYSMMLKKRKKSK
jgi:hypothetical protein